MKTRASRRDGSQAIRPGFLAVKEKVTLPMRTEADDLFEKDDKNPDVIPNNKGKYVQKFSLRFVGNKFELKFEDVSIVM